MKENEEISDHERQKLLNSLHKRLFWVGEEIPYKINIDGNEVHLHEVIWEIVNKQELEEADLQNIELLLEMLCRKEKEYEKCIEHEHLSYEKANAIFEKAAGIRRAIMDLMELTVSSKRKIIFKCRQICNDVNTCEWDCLTETIKEQSKF